MSENKGTHRSSVPPGTNVQVVQKHHQRTGELTDGIVSRNLTRSMIHPHGQKVMLTSGIVGRVQSIVPSASKHIEDSSIKSEIHMPQQKLFHLDNPKGNNKKLRKNSTSSNTGTGRTWTYIGGKLKENLSFDGEISSNPK